MGYVVPIVKPEHYNMVLARAMKRRDGRCVIDIHAAFYSVMTAVASEYNIQ